MEDLYENVLFGTFIFKLGYKMGELGSLKTDMLQTSSSTLRSTPLRVTSLE